MKKFVSLLIVLAMILSVCACTSGDPSAKPESPVTTTEPSVNEENQEVSSEQKEDTTVEVPEDIVPEADEGATVEVDESLLSVEITLPASFFEEEETEESIKAAAEENGISDCKVNDDGSVTYKMSKAKHKEMLEEMKVSLEQTIDDMINGEEAVASFLNIEHKEDFSKFDVFVDPELYTDWDSFYVLAFYLSGAYYQMFEGKDVDKIDVVVDFINNTTNEIISTSSYREWIESEAFSD